MNNVRGNEDINVDSLNYQSALAYYSEFIKNNAHEDEGDYILNKDYVKNNTMIVTKYDIDQLGKVKSSVKIDNIIFSIDEDIINKQKEILYSIALMNDLIHKISHSDPNGDKKEITQLIYNLAECESNVENCKLELKMMEDSLNMLNELAK